MFFEQISESEITAFLRSRLHRTKPESIYWCFHTKSVLSYTELNRLAASGGCGGRFGLSLLNLACIVSDDSGEPVFYRVLEDHVNDPLAAAQLLSTASDLRTSHIDLVIDSVLTSPSRLDRLYEQHIGFICGFNTDENICESAVDSLAPQLSSDGPDTFLAEYGVQAKTLKTFWPHRDKETHNPENGPLKFIWTRFVLPVKKKYC